MDGEYTTAQLIQSPSTCNSSECDKIHNKAKVAAIYSPGHDKIVHLQQLQFCQCPIMLENILP